MCEINKKNINLVINLCEESDVRVPKKFKELLTGIGYASPSCEKMADFAFDLTIKIFNNAFESGFGFSTKNDIKNILTQWSTLTSPKAMQMQYNFGDILDRINKTYKKERNNIMIKDVVVKYIDETIEGLEILKKDKVIKTDVLESGINKIIEIKEIVLSTVDNISQNANNYAEDIINGLKRWRENARQQLILKDDEKILDELLVRASKWQNINRIPNKKEYVKEEDKVKYKESLFTRTIKMQKVTDVAEQFFKVLKTKSEEINNVYSLYEEIQKQNKKIKEIDDKIEKWDIKYENGECTIAENDVAIQRLENDKKIIEIKLKQNEIINKQNESTFLNMKMLISKFEILKPYYLSFKGSRQNDFYDIFSQIDFSRFIAVLNGYGGNKAIEDVEVYLDATLNEIDEINRKMFEQNTIIDKTFNKHFENKNTNQETVTQEQKDIERRKRFEERKKNRQSKETQQQPEQIQNIDKIIITSNDN